MRETCFLTTKDFTILEVMRDRCLGRDDPLAPILKRKIETATVVRGDSLWRISRHSYGSGDLYSRIFKANRGKIHDPNLIYPSQIFVLPPR